MNQQVIATQFLNLGGFLQDQVFPELLRRFRQHHLIRPYIETALIFCYRWATWLNPNLTEAHFRLGRLFQKQQKWQEAATAFEQVTKSDYFKLADAYCNLGLVQSKLKLLEESIFALHKAIELEPEQYWYYRVLGRVLGEKDEHAEMIKNYQIASQKKINQTHPHVVLKRQEEQHLSTPNFISIWTHIYIL